MPVPALLRSRRGVLAVVAVVLVMLAVVGWRVLAARAQDAVLVGNLYALRCTDPAIAQMDPRWRVTLVPDMDCRLTVDVSRPGRVPVRLVEVRYPALGPRGALSARVDSLRWGGRTYRPVPGEEDAVFRIDRVVPRSGFFQEAVGHLSYRPGNCRMAAGTAFARIPVVTLRAYGVRREVRPDATTYLRMDPRRAGRSCPGDDD